MNFDFHSTLEENDSLTYSFPSWHVCSGFEREDVWGYRSLEPNRCCIASIALVLLKTGIVHPPLSSTSTSDLSDKLSTNFSDKMSFTTASDLDDGTGGVQVNAQQLATAQKLLLFWRKPAVSSLSHSRCVPDELIRTSHLPIQRKCWWDATNLTINAGTDQEREIKVWARRVWTLELSLI